MRTAIVLLAFLLSGSAALVYEVCWLRRAALVFGSTTFAVSTVLAVFFLGLALGSDAFGRLATRARHPLRWFAALELGVAALGLASPFAFDAVDALYGSVYRAAGAVEGSASLVALRALLVAGVLLPPTFLMGGSLPLLCRELVRREGRIAAGVGGLYALNTLGAALGCAAAGLWLLPAIGLRATIAAGAGLQLLVAGAVLAVARSGGAPPASVDGAAPAASDSRERTLVGVLVFVIGFVALGCEVLWTRFLALIVRHTVETFTLTLSVVLVGIVLGSALAALRLDRTGARAFVFGALQVATGLSVLGLMLLPADTWLGIRDRLAATALLMLPPAVLSGACFPVAVRLVARDPARVGADVGRLAALNTLGGIAGSLAVGFGALPLLGIHATLLLLTGVSLAGGCAAWLLLARTHAAPLRAVAVAAAVAAWVALPIASPTRVPEDFLADPGEVLVDHRSGRAANVAVLRRGATLQLEIDRWWQGEDRKNHQALAAHVPLLLHAHPERVLVVGAGAGQTPARVLMHDVDTLVCVDIEPAVFEVIRDHFDAGWMDDPRVTLVRDDGRSYVAHGDARFDLISLELGQVFRPGVAFFYTVDFYRRARERLAPGGLVAQFVPLPFFTLEQLRGVLRSFREVFPESLLWYNTAELLLIGTAGDGFSLEAARLAQIETDPRLHADLDFAHWGGPERSLHHREVFLAGFLTGPRGVAALAEGGALYRDDRPVLDHATAHLDADATLEIPLVAALRPQLASPREVLGVPLSDAEAAAVRRIRDANLEDVVAGALARRAAQHIRSGELEPASALLGEAESRSPGSFDTQLLLGELALLRGDALAAHDHFARARRLRSGDTRARRGLATALYRLDRLDAAMGHFRGLLRQLPGDPEIHNDLGAALARRGEIDAAITHFETAIRLRPGFPDAQQNLERARALAAPPRR